jgi:MerR family copper efflux transcriptional regulator
MNVDKLRISQLAERADVPVSTVRYYERIGLLAPPERLNNGYRVYDESAAEHLAFIGRAKRMGVPLEEVSELIELWSTGGCRPLQDRIRAFLGGRIIEVRAQRRERHERASRAASSTLMTRPIGSPNGQKRSMPATSPSALAAS